MLDILEKNSKVYIVGAQSRAKTLSGYIKEIYPEIEILAYLVDDVSQNEEYVFGVPVCHMSSLTDYEKAAPIFIATKGVYHKDIKKQLVEKGFQHIIPVTVEVDNYLRNEYVKCIFGSEGRAFEKLDDICMEFEEDAPSVLYDCSEACIYVAKSVYDKPLESEYLFAPYEQPIQVGAALTEERLMNVDGMPMLTDDIGDHISNKNRQYCELTALYWIWKHTQKKIVGLAHYRRHFILRDDWQLCMSKENIDVILPVPTCVLPNIADNYRERHDASDWDFLMEYLKKFYSQDVMAAEYVFGKTLYSPCNMFIAKREVVNALCEWMFPILDKVIEHGGMKEDVYQNRYAGFISERLITLFFHLHQNDYKIVYANRTFLR